MEFLKFIYIYFYINKLFLYVKNNKKKKKFNNNHKK